MLDEQVDGTGRCVGAHQFGLFEGAAEVEVICRPLTHCQTQAGLVQLLDALVRSVVIYQVGALDQHVRFAKGNLCLAHRLDREESQVPGTLFQGGENLAGGIEGAHFQIDAKFFRQGFGQGNRDALRFTIRATLG
ncbi:hypothetical protein D3C72_1835140 [compost metagenome]